MITSPPLDSFHPFEHGGGKGMDPPDPPAGGAGPHMRTRAGGGAVPGRGRLARAGAAYAAAGGGGPMRAGLGGPTRAACGRAWALARLPTGLLQGVAARQAPALLPPAVFLQ